MKIEYLHIENYKNLKNFKLDLSNTNVKKPVIFLGENGCGKSTLFEAITDIFVFLEQNSVSKLRAFNIGNMFDFEIKYSCRGNDIKVSKYGMMEEYMVGDKVLESKEEFLDLTNRPISLFAAGGIELTAKGKPISARNESRYVPQRIIFYDSSKHSRLERKYRDMQNALKRQNRRKSLNVLRDKGILIIDRTVSEFNFNNKYFYPELSKLPLILASLLFDESFTKGEIFNAYFDDLKLVTCRVSIKYNKQNNDGNDIYQQDSEDYVFRMLSDLDETYTSMLYRSSRLDFKDEIVFDIMQYNQFEAMNKTEFYEYLDKASQLFEVKISIAFERNGKRLTFKDLSSGEQQVITVMGMILLYNKEDSLIILDEPEVHLNSKWKYGYLDLLTEILEKSNIDSQLMIATHDPLMVNGVDKKQVRLMTNNPNTEKYLYCEEDSSNPLINEPYRDTYGMGVDGLLESEIFGLKTAYDKKTSKDFNCRNELYSKLINNELDGKGKEALKTLTLELGELPAFNTSIDYLYDDFRREYKKSEYYLKEYLNPSEVNCRNEKVREIIDELFKVKR